jgi:hypothetical protein
VLKINNLIYCLTKFFLIMKKITKFLFVSIVLLLSGSTYGQYCAADGGNDEYISGVELGSINNTGTTADGYHDYTALSTDLYQGESASITVTNGNSYSADDLGVWVDWNQDSDFDDADENVVCESGNGGQGTYSFTIPAGATLGATVMRVRIKYSGSDCGSPCGSTTYGEVEDYTINVTAPPSCTKPTDLTESNLTSNSVTISWTAGGSETTWEYAYGVAPMAEPTGSGTSTTSTSVNLSGLTADTEYDWYVRADCGGGSYSGWAKSSFYTGYCTPAPTSVDGDGITNVTMGTIDNDTGDEPGHYGDYTAQVTDAPQSTSFAIDITLETGYTYYLWAWVDWNDDLDFDDADEETYLGESSSDNPTTFNGSISIPASAALGHHRIRIGGSDIGLGNTSPSNPCYTGSWACFEDYTLNVTSPPACPDPSSQTVSGITTTSADLGWTENGTATTWNIEYGPTGFTQGSGTTVAAGTNPYTLTGLSSSTTYDWYVQADCGGGSISAWVGPHTFTTSCTPLALPYYEDFDGGTEWPACWSEGGDLDVFSLGNPFSGAGSSVYCTYANQGHGYLYSPEFDATGSSGVHVRFFHYWRANWSNETQDGYFYGSPDGGTTQYLLGEWHHNNPSLIFGWNEYEISSWADGASNLTFWFDLDMGDDFYWFIDYFEVKEGAFNQHGLWTGATDSDWHTASNWADGIVPFSLSSVSIPTGLTNYPTLGADGYCAYMDVASDATGDASLLTAGNLAMTSSGSATVHRYVTTDQWHLIGASTSGNQSGMFEGDWLQYFDEGSNSYGFVSVVYRDLELGEGYAFYDKTGEGTDNNFAYVGNLASTVTRNLTRGAAGSNNGWNLVANPYPSAIDWDAAAGWTKTNVGGTIYTYDGAAKGWRTYNSATGTGTNGGTNIVPMGQGFFVSVNDDGSTTGDLGFDYDVQVHSSQAFLKGQDLPANGLSVTVSNEVGTDELVVIFNKDATTSFDSEYDAYKLMSMDQDMPQIYVDSDVKYANYTSPEVESVPVNVMVVNPSGEYTISLNANNGFDNVTLEDTYTGELTDLLAGDYTFEYVDNLDARFILHFSPLSVEEDMAQLVKVFAYDHNINVSIPADVDAEISIVNVLGQEVARTTAHSGMNTITVEEGTYMVRIISEGVVVTEKVYVK